MGVQRSERGGDGKKKGPSNYTFNNVEMNQMGRENERLLGRMIDIKAGKRGPAGGGFSHNETYDRRKHMSSNAINRRRKDDKIARENQKIANRLRSVASTSGRSGGGGGGGGGARSSGYGAVEPWRKPQKNAALRQKKTLVQPAWNDRPLGHQLGESIRGRSRERRPKLTRWRCGACGWRGVVLYKNKQGRGSGRGSASGSPARRPAAGELRRWAARKCRGFCSN